MALITCVECGNKVSDLAESCPECGCPVELKITCFECGESISNEFEKCPKCGVPLKEISKNKAYKKEPINFFKAENTIKTPKIDWNNKTIKFLSWVFFGIALIYFLKSIFAPSPPIMVPNRSVPFSNPGASVCQSCRILGDCSAFPQCTRQSNCQLRFNDITGNWERNCSSF